jgi:hypothetical protein
MKKVDQHLTRYQQKMPDHRRLCSGHRDRQRLACGRPKFDDVCAVSLAANARTVIQKILTESPKNLQKISKES